MDNKKMNRKVFWLILLIGFVVSLIFFFVIYPIIAHYAGWYWTEKPLLAELLYNLLYIMGVKNSFDLVYARFGLFSEFRNVPLPVYDALLSILIFIIFIILGVILGKKIPQSEEKEIKQKKSVKRNLPKSTDTSDDLKLF